MDAAEQWEPDEARASRPVPASARLGEIPPRDSYLIVGFEHETDARRFLDAMRERLEKFALSLHPDKTRLIEFGRYAADRRAQRGLGKPESFSFLGFTFICGKSRQGTFQLKRKTRRDRMRAKLRAVKQEMRRRMNQPIPLQGKWLQQIVSGYFNYHAVPTNSRALHAFRHSVAELWQRSLRRRSQKDWTTKEADRAVGQRLAPQNRRSFTPGRNGGSPSNTRGGSRMPELGPYGSVRGALSNGRLYRNSESAPRLFHLGYRGRKGTI